MPSPSLQRRAFLSKAAMLGGAAALASPAVAQSAPQIRWRLTSSFPKSLDTIFGTAEMLAKYVAEATDNRFQIQTFAAGELVPGLQALDAVTNGSIECAHTPTYFYTGKDPTLAFGTGIPFGLNARQSQAWWTFGGGAEIIGETLRRFNVVGLVAGNSGCQMGGWFRKEINGIDDLKGLKFRISGMGGAVLARLGVVPQQINPAEIYAALERGTIDAAEFVGPHDDEKLGLSRVAKYYYYPGWWEGGAMLHLLVNQEKWNALPKAYQAILTQAGETANNWMIAKYDVVNAPALRRLIAGGAQLRAFPPAVMEACFKAAQEHYTTLAAQNPSFKRALESFEGFRREQLGWWQIADHYYDTAVMSLLRARG